MSEEHDDSQDSTERQSSQTTDTEPRSGKSAAGWFAASTLRVGLALIGFILLLFALGRAIGFDLLGLVVDALGTRVGGWLMVAFFALLIIIVAARGFGTWPE